MATPLPPNRAPFTVAEIVEATGGEVVAHGSASAAAGVSTDTRAIEDGTCFVALRGEKHDGHAHLAAAREKGAAIAVVDRDVEAPAGLTVIRTADSLVALGDLARFHARRWRSAGEGRAGRRVVALTGSAGKTTTRVAISALLEEVTTGVHSTRGNLNNRVGAPLVLLGLEPEHRFAVVELGMNQPGEIKELARIVEPDVGLCTLVAAAHTELLGGIDGVAREKRALLDALAKTGVALGNADDAIVASFLAEAPPARRISYGARPSAEVVIRGREPVGMTSSRLRLMVPAEELALDFETPLLGDAGAYASAAAVAVVHLALGFPVDSATCQRAFAKADVGAGAGRLLPRVFASGLAIIDDTYNANPTSTCASIRAAAEIARATKRRLLLALGEMRELGAESAPGHDQVGRAAAESGAAFLVAIGGGDAPRIAARAAEGGIKAAYAERVEDAAVLLGMQGLGEDLLLVKGSRSIGTERVIALLGEQSAGVKA